jgi:hypothetical protein
MSKFLQICLIICAGTILFSSPVLTQKKLDAASKAQELLKNYKPPAPTNPAPTETPEQAWKRLFDQESSRQGKIQKAPSTGVITAPKTSQYHNGAVSESWIKSIGSKPLTPQEIKKQADGQIQQAQNNGKGASWELQQRGIKSPQFLTTQQQQQIIDENARTLQSGQKPSHLTDTKEIRNFLEKTYPDSKTSPRTTNGAYVGTFMGTVYQDDNHNGAQDTNEAGLPGWKVWFYEYNTGKYDTLTSDAQGHFFYDDTDGVGSYYMYEIQQAGYQEIQPWRDGYYSWYQSTDTVRNLNFGNWKIVPRILEGTVYNDSNKNGIKDAGEKGIGGFQIGIYKYTMGYWTYVTTDSNGHYSLADSSYQGWYQVAQTDQFGWLRTTASYYYFDGGWGGTTSNLDFGNWLVPRKKISGYVYNDVNHNGTLDAGDTGLEGWQVSLYRYQDGQSTYLTTDKNGYWSYADSGYACYYNISESNQAGWLQTQPSSYYQVYSAGDTLSNENFGNWLVPYSSIRGTVFNDANNNGIMDAGEVGLPNWTVSAYDEYSGVTYKKTSDAQGKYQFDSLTWVSYYQVSEAMQLDWLKTYPAGDYWRPYVAGDTVENVDFGNYLPPMGELRVNTLPSNSVSVSYGNALAGQAIDIWGNVHGGLVPLHYVLDYGDGTIDSGLVTDRHFIGGLHTYETAGPKTMALSVRDANGNVDRSESVVRVFAVPTLQIKVNMAIEKGLLFNYKNQYPDGHLYDGYGNIPSTGSAMLAFEENGHLPKNDIRTDIYAEYVQAGLDFLYNSVHTMSISVQEAGNPDSDGNGLGAYFNDGENYANGVAALAVLGSHKNQTDAKADTIRFGPYAGKTVFDLMVDIVDQIAFSQTDPSSGSQRGGWRYSVAYANYGSSDNSATQWPGLVLEAAQNSWGMAIPQFVKDELLLWLQYSQDGTGGFAYTSTGSWNNLAKTGAGIGGYASLGYTTDSASVSNAINFLSTHWNDTYDNNGYTEGFNGNLYAMYAVAKGLRIINHRVPVSNVGIHNWYNEYADHLLNNPSWGQQANGSWNASTWTNGYPPLSTSFAILILTQGVIVPPPVAIIAPLDSKPPNTSFTVDGSGSFHQDPSKSIIEWLWDFDASNGIDWNHPNASGPIPINPGYAQEGTYTITLRVKDNSDPPMYSVNTVNVEIKLGHHPPVAVAIPPGRGPSYAAKIGEPILLDGRASYSPDFPKDSVVRYNWDLNGDGIFGDSFSDTITVVFNDIHQGVVGLRVYDTQGDSSSNVAYINIVASKMDLFVDQFTVDPSKVYLEGTVKLWARFKNDPTSNTDAKNVLVRFYDDNPLTIGNRLGGDFYLQLPVGGTDTASTYVTLSSRITAGMKHFYVYLDASGQFAEWDEKNNIDSVGVEVAVPPPHILMTTECLNYSTLKLGDSLTLAVHIGNDGPGSLTIDSIVFSGPDFAVGAFDSTVPSNGSVDVPIMFKPLQSGFVHPTATFYTNDGVHVVVLNGQGELQATGNGGEIFSGIAAIDGQAALPGTVIGAYRYNGDLITSSLVYVTKNGLTNYSLTVLEGQAGIADGDTIIFKVNTLNCEILTERYCQPQRMAIFHPANPFEDTPYDVDIVHMATLKIPVISGYNAISWNLWNIDNSVKSIFGNLLSANKVKIILDYINDGQGEGRFDYFIPQLGDYNPFMSTNFRKGYFLRMLDDRQPDSLVFTGLPMCPEVPIQLFKGYNFVSYLPQSPDSTGHALGGLIPNTLTNALDWVNIGAGQEFFNTYPNGDFTTMMPGKGYFVNVDSQQVLTYPGSSVITAKAAHVTKKVTASGSVKSNLSFSSNSLPIPMAVFAYGKKVAISGKLIPKGSDVKAVDKDGYVCGTSTFVADGIFSIAIYADNPATPQHEGPAPGDMVKLFVNNQMIAQQVKWTEFGDVIVVDDAQQVTGVLYEKALPTSYALHQNYPNPFNPVTTIRYELPKASHVTITIYNMLGQQVRVLEQSDQQPGYYQSIWDGRNDDGISVSSGIYTYRIAAVADNATFVDVHKMILIK